MEIRHQLRPKLKSLRLSGILETLDVRTQQAITEQLSYVEFLQRLIEDEVERRTQKQLALRLRRAAVDLGKTLEGFDFGFNPGLNRQQIRRQTRRPHRSLDAATAAPTRAHKALVYGVAHTQNNHGVWQADDARTGPRSGENDGPLRAQLDNPRISSVAASHDVWSKARRMVWPPSVP
jgi:hypothetical protein